MKQRQKILVSCMGSYWLLSRTKYRKVLAELAAKGGVNLMDYGQPFRKEAVNITDMDPEEAKELLEEEEI